MPTKPLVINDPSVFKERRSVRKNGTLGKGRITIDVEAEAIAHHFDARIGAPTAEAIREVIAEGIRNITAVARPATLEARKRVHAAWQRGASWAKRRYGGGRIGDTPPDPSKVRLFNHSSRLVNNLFTRFNSGDESFTTNVPANRFSDDAFNSADKQRVLQRLAQLVPALTQPGRLMGDRRVQEGLKESVDLLMQKLGKSGDLKIGELRRIQASVIRQTLGLAGLI